MNLDLAALEWRQSTTGMWHAFRSGQALCGYAILGGAIKARERDWTPNTEGVCCRNCAGELGVRVERPPKAGAYRRAPHGRRNQFTRTRRSSRVRGPRRAIVSTGRTDDLLECGHYVRITHGNAVRRRVCPECGSAKSATEAA